jgi:wyosine [tRNA(Phe)-imidazoG37] synthetase (radical SAM superfamily)
MTKMLIRVDGELTEELLSAFPHLTTRTHRTQTTLVGDLADQQELQGVLNLLQSLSIDVVEIVTIPED